MIHAGYTTGFESHHKPVWIITTVRVCRAARWLKCNPNEPADTPSPGAHTCEFHTVLEPNLLLNIRINTKFPRRLPNLKQARVVLLCNANLNHKVELTLLSSLSLLLVAMSTKTLTSDAFWWTLRRIFKANLTKTGERIFQSDQCAPQKHYVCSSYSRINRRVWASSRVTCIRDRTQGKHIYHQRKRKQQQMWAQDLCKKQRMERWWPTDMKKWAAGSGNGTLWSQGMKCILGYELW